MLNNINTRPNKFDQAIKRLQKFSEKSTPGKLSTVKTESGPFGLFKHKVTGEELNLMTANINKNFIEYNEQINSIIKEFGEVYNAFESLDKDYIQGIIIAIKSAELASQQANTAQENTAETISALAESIRKLTAIRDTFTQEIKELKESVKKLEASRGIGLELPQCWAKLDSTWQDVQKHKGNLLSLNQKIEVLNSLQKSLDDKVQSLKDFQHNIQKYAHIQDIDSIWDDIQSINADLNDISEQISKNHKFFALKLAESEKQQNQVDNILRTQKTEFETKNNNTLELIERLKRKSEEKNDEISHRILTLNSNLTTLSEEVFQINKNLQASDKLIEETFENRQKHLSEQIANLSHKVSSDLKQSVDILNERDEKLNTSLKITEHNLTFTRETLKKSISTLSDRIEHKLEQIQNNVQEKDSDQKENLKKLKAEFNQAKIELNSNITTSIKEISDSVKSTKNELNKTIFTLSQGTHDSIEKINSELLRITEEETLRYKHLSKKLNISYTIGGAALIITTIHLFLKILNVL